MQGLGFAAWASVPVHHCRDAYGLVLQHRAGWKLVYSGDTRPCPALYAAGRGATVLLHEATFEPCLADQALAKRHSTSAEALAAAQAVGAYRLVMTHFSQRYPGVPAGLDLAAAPWGRRPLLAFDGMRLPFSLLPDLPAAMPLLHYAFPPADECARRGEAAAAAADEDEDEDSGGDGGGLFPPGPFRL